MRDYHITYTIRDLTKTETIRANSNANAIRSLWATLDRRARLYIKIESIKLS